jgi:hypothetical protein
MNHAVAVPVVFPVIIIVIAGGGGAAAAVVVVVVYFIITILLLVRLFIASGSVLVANGWLCLL